MYEIGFHQSFLRNMMPDEMPDEVIIKSSISRYNFDDNFNQEKAKMKVLPAFDLLQHVEQPSLEGACCNTHLLQCNGN